VPLASVQTLDTNDRYNFIAGIGAMVLGGTASNAPVQPVPKILYVRQSGRDLKVVFCMTLLPTADLLDGAQLYHELTEANRLAYFTSASGGVPSLYGNSFVIGPTGDCAPAGAVIEVEKVVDWSVVGTILAVLGLFILGSALVCIASGCGRVQAQPAYVTTPVVVQPNPDIVATARTKYVRELISPIGPTDTIVDLGMGLNSNTTLHTHL
jgi:hypothetical protein